MCGARYDHEVDSDTLQMVNADTYNGKHLLIEIRYRAVIGCCTLKMGALPTNQRCAIAVFIGA